MVTTITERTGTSPYRGVVVATDGSHHEGKRGYGYVFADGRYDFGSCSIDEDCELGAIHRVLMQVHADVPLTVLTDSQEVILRLRDGVAPKPRNHYRDQFLTMMQEVSKRNVSFVYVQQKEKVVPLHAVAHYLSFLGRQGRHPVIGKPAPCSERILGADNPDAEAHHIVCEHLFPAIRSY